MDSLQAALAQHRPGHALPQAFHTSPEIHAHELDAIWRRSWLLAGVSAQAPEPGDFFSFELGDDSLIVARGQDGVLHALHNTCRHRGMRVCHEAAGQAKHWVCPYHQWSYSLDGRLLGAGGMERELDLSGHDLLSSPVEEVGGLIFVWLDGAEPEPFVAARDALSGALAPQGLDRARVAHTAEYVVRANWKLVWENNRECWHCHVGHPQYVKANFDSVPDTEQNRVLALTRQAEHDRVLAGGQPDAGTDGSWDRAAATSSDGAGPRARPGSTDLHAEPGLYPFPTPGTWWSANRTPLVPGFVTESLDGQPVAPLMGSYPDHDVGTLRMRTVPNFWAHASADHAVITRLLPDGPERTRLSVSWLVNAEAVEGRDYELDRLLPFWQLTSEQDWELCERNYAGVRSPAYVPGPYSPSREYNVAAFTDWYLDRIRTRSA